MGVITRVSNNKTGDRVWVFIDGEYCTSIRERTFKAMGLGVGDEITCDELKEREKFFWKRTYGASSWEAEKVRLNKVSAFIREIDLRLGVEVIGFGADTTEIIYAHPEVSGTPDLRVFNTETNEVMCLVEVTGATQRRGWTYWIRPDKVLYAQKSQIPVWCAVHYEKPSELMRFIKPVVGKDYSVSKMDIRGATEHFVEFSEGDAEVFAPDLMSNWFKQLLSTQ